MKIINFGSLNLDEIYKVEHICASGETLRVLEFQRSIGGKGLNQSIAAARAGASVLHAGKIGKEGVCLQSFLAENGVDVSMIQLCDEPQGRAIIQLTPQADNCIFVYGGSNRAIDIPFIDDCLSHAQPGDWLMTQNEISNLPYLLNAAARRKMHIFLNASPVDAELARMDLSCVDWITVNETECCQLTGCPDTRKAYETLRTRFPHTGILLTLGADGSVCWKDGHEYRQDAFPASAVDTTAAGDTFAGYFVSCLTEGRGIPDALRTAAKAAAIAVSSPGAAPSIPWRNAVDASYLEAGTVSCCEASEIVKEVRG